ncbi:MAG TPA: PH domain-containing protein [Tepidisphaeraceae bacterium]|nr:PH domain-containing protein [Tepidisphaeraceae bacterium]
MNDRFKGSRFRRSTRRRRTLRPWKPVAGGTDLPWPMHASEAAGGATVSAPAVAAPAVTPSLATLMTRHILRDGEIVLLMLKPSLWSIFFNTLPAIALAVIIALTTKIGAPRSFHIGVESGLMLTACWTAWAVLSWSGRLYLLTDMRVVRISGIFTPQIHDIPLRKVARTRLVVTLKERLWRLGSIEIIPESDHWPWSIWQTIARPQKVHETIRRAIARAKQGGCFGDL